MKGVVVFFVLYIMLLQESQAVRVSAVFEDWDKDLESVTFYLPHQQDEVEILDVRPKERIDISKSASVQNGDTIGYSIKSNYVGAAEFEQNEEIKLEYGPSEELEAIKLIFTPIEDASPKMGGPWFTCRLGCKFSEVATGKALQNKEPNDEESSHITRELVPPAVTISNYIDTLSVGETINRWGGKIGNLNSWFQKNMEWIQAANGGPLENFPLFQVTKIPVRVNHNTIRCDYSLPVAGSNPRKRLSTLSLFREATPEEIEEVRKLKQESREDYIVRLLQWQKKLRNSQ
ncbi:MAG: hypothetical protein ACD_16C00147G0006 [uncultured bacterium]|nr:MAG: hypothetical protein ACD_16C00147G0006 [uncultured bacterium]OFW69496.1 MAG: hypothetical protein A2X70_04085 [Alphaproteobacteria bacterium GWC2_42_16]OFW74231.1 MAG: hypothetical protein A2Z80_04925 [Alphaproteobacteria bacterium GWA2_41_27]OFW83225.1 MAG: hypothetical protein A3E50_00995 [Alphaproteobacteria bacterium RIFCSPHIGHO2_12_FULL_42_100]OFW86010.1 MAG: hypothetical protein A2W06_06820 [Alphaproteobacteria bacterium RBG_16_42_14]OFW92051.1 MAG: hypothetical protein A3C41_015